ncbi:MAG: hypothetical protein JO137_04210 [Hyphomicrobiales bacterium]|nr:hypothetical protein [Hyphomicrobiales bacterium]MBV9431007.1 hypothetical protein [Hyphomicrobiales bacterium]
MPALALIACGALAGLCARATALAAETRPAPLAVDVTNASEAESCAEKDNVTVTFASPRLRRFRIEAVHPAYIGAVTGDGESREPDWTDCDIAHGEETAAPTERRITFYESPFLWVTGYEFSDYWRRRDVPVRIGDRVEHNLTMVQLWIFVHGKAEQVLVFYPTDGIWRIHPLPPAHLPWSAYGSSFFVGPVQMKERPIVEIKEVGFDPASKSFRLTFADGGHGEVKVTDVDESHITLDVAFDQAIENEPFAALRSMYVTEFNADVARIALQRPEARSWLEEPIMNFHGAKATKAWMGRLVPSRHNISAPDLVFSGFTSGEAAP